MGRLKPSWVYRQIYGDSPEEVSSCKELEGCREGVEWGRKEWNGAMIGWGWGQIRPGKMVGLAAVVSAESQTLCYMGHPSMFKVHALQELWNFSLWICIPCSSLCPHLFFLSLSVKVNWKKDTSTSFHYLTDLFVDCLSSLDGCWRIDSSQPTCCDWHVTTLWHSGSLDQDGMGSSGVGWPGGFNSLESRLVKVKPKDILIFCICWYSLCGSPCLHSC